MCSPTHKYWKFKNKTKGRHLSKEVEQQSGNRSPRDSLNVGQLHSLRVSSVNYAS